MLVNREDRSRNRIFSTLNSQFLSSVQFSSVAQPCPTLCDPMNRSTPGLPVHHQLPEFTQIHVHQVHDAIQPFVLGRPLLLLPPIPPSIRVFSNESTLRMRWPKYWSFSFSISPIDFAKLPTKETTLHSFCLQNRLYNFLISAHQTAINGTSV